MENLKIKQKKEMKTYKNILSNKYNCGRSMEVRRKKKLLTVKQLRNKRR